MEYIIKRDGRKVLFDKEKVYNAICKAFAEVDGNLFSKEIPEKISLDIAAWIFASLDKENKTVEEIQDKVEELLMFSNRKDVARAYIRYRYKKEIMRSANKTYKSILDLIDQENEELKEENSNKNPTIVSTQRDYMAGEVSKDITRKFLLPDEVVKAHDEGLIHFHDADYFAQRSINCCLVNLEDILQNGTVINGTLIEKPHSFATACNIATQVMAQIASGQYGGQSVSLSHLAPFVDISRQKITKDVEEEFSIFAENDEVKQKKKETIGKRVREEVKKGVQTIQYQINTLQTTNGQTPFVSIFMWINEVEDEQTKRDLALIIEEVLIQRTQGVKNEKGVFVTPSFPKLLYVLDENNIHEDSEYYYLTELAAKCTAKRMVPDYISAKVMKRIKEDKNGNGQVYPCMGCRSFLPTYIDENNKPKYYGRFNFGVVTINLIDVACSAKDLDDFWKILEERLELCHKALQTRYKRLKDATSDISPIHWQHGGLARLEKGEKITKLLHNDYASLSLGYCGVWETVYKLIGKKLTEKEGLELGKKIMQKLNDKCEEWKEAEKIGYSVYGTPIESTVYKFAKSLQKRFGIIEGVTDKNYITNSYHIKVTEPIDAFSKIKIESELQELSPGGAITYVEVGDLTKNIDAVISLIKFIYDNILYAEINIKSDYCCNCGFDGQIQIKEDEETNRLYWECPNCGNTDQSKMSVARRTCGYIGSNYWNQGRTLEIKERVEHLE